ncbi:hypothetical protein T484DRAFT_1747892 [Baffinella frigidus]|nr:hypothetical protein T484DRAFT_1747892 [Cryptophyta sp. CCMP2293]
MVAHDPLPTQSAVPKPPFPWSAPVSPVVKTAPRRFPPVGMRHPSNADKKAAQHHHYKTSFHRAASDSSELDNPHQESRGDQLRKQFDPRGYLLEILNQRAPIKRNPVKANSLESIIEPETTLVSPNLLLGVSEIRNACSFHVSKRPLTEDNKPSLRRGSTSVETKSLSGIRNASSFRMSTDDSQSSRRPPELRLGSPSEPASPLPTPPSSLGPRAQRRYSEAPRLVIRDVSPALTYSPLSDLGPRASSESKIRIMWQPLSKEIFKHDFFPEDASSVPSLVFSAGSASPRGCNGRYWNPQSH